MRDIFAVGCAANIDQRRDVMGVEERQKFFGREVAVSDGVESVNCIFCSIVSTIAHCLCIKEWNFQSSLGVLGESTGKFSSVFRHGFVLPFPHCADYVSPELGNYFPIQTPIYRSQ